MQMLERVAIGLSVTSVVCLGFGKLMMDNSARGGIVSKSGIILSKISLVTMPLAFSAVFSDAAFRVLLA